MGKKNKTNDAAAGDNEPTGDDQNDNVVELQTALSAKSAAETMTELRNLEQVKDDAQMEVAGYYKRLKEKGGHDTAVIKLARRIDRMAPDKRHVFLAEIDRWRKCLGWDDQGNLFEQTSDLPADAARAADDAAGSDQPSEEALVATGGDEQPAEIFAD